MLLNLNEIFPIYSRNTGLWIVNACASFYVIDLFYGPTKVAAPKIQYCTELMRMITPGLQVKSESAHPNMKSLFPSSFTFSAHHLSVWPASDR